MKLNKSPAHKTIQLKRRNEKVQNYKCQSEKQNENNNLHFEEHRCKNTRSKQNSVDKRPKAVLKKSSTLTHQLNKVFKKGSQPNRTLNPKNPSRQFSQPKKHTLNYSLSRKQHTLHGLIHLFNQLNQEPNHQIIKMKYIELLRNVQTETSERKLVESLFTHIFHWMERCEEMKETIEILTTVTPKLQAQNIRSEAIDLSNPTEEIEDGSVCSYLADPEIKVTMTNLRPEMKQKLQLNFSKVEELRREFS